MYDNKTGKHYCNVCGKQIDTTKPYMLSERSEDIGTELEAVCHRHMGELRRFPEDVQKILLGCA